MAPSLSSIVQLQLKMYMLSLSLTSQVQTRIDIIKQDQGSIFEIRAQVELAETTNSCY